MHVCTNFLHSSWVWMAVKWSYTTFRQIHFLNAGSDVDSWRCCIPSSGLCIVVVTHMPPVQKLNYRKLMCGLNFLMYRAVFSGCFSSLTYTLKIDGQISGVKNKLQHGNNCKIQYSMLFFFLFTVSDLTFTFGVMDGSKNTQTWPDRDTVTFAMLILVV